MTEAPNPYYNSPQVTPAKIRYWVRLSCGFYRHGNMQYHTLILREVQVSEDAPWADFYEDLLSCFRREYMLDADCPLFVVSDDIRELE